MRTFTRRPRFHPTVSPYSYFPLIINCIKFLLFHPLEGEPGVVIAHCGSAPRNLSTPASRTPTNGRIFDGDHTVPRTAHDPALSADRLAELCCECECILNAEEKEANQHNARFRIRWLVVIDDGQHVVIRRGPRDAGKIRNSGLAKKDK